MTAGTNASTEGGNYEYVTARVRSRRGALFDDDDYRKLVRMGPSGIARFMEDSEYEAEMNALGARHSGVDLVEYALNRNLAKHFNDVLGWASGRLYEDIARYLRKFDAWNIKTVLRGRYSGASREAIEEDLIEAGELAGEQLEHLLDAASIEDAVDRLEGTIFGPALADALREYEETGLLVPLENATDRAFYEHLVDDAPAADDQARLLYGEFLAAEIDFRNLRNALRLARSESDIEPAAYFIAGGRLFDEAEIRQLAANTDQLVEHVRNSIYGDDLDAALDALDDAATLAEFERALEAALLEYASTLSNRYPLSICPVLAYILAKEREVDNVRAIARGREVGLEPEEIEQELVIR
jgi:V/A-type H+-transporting ATPase subunit C